MSDVDGYLNIGIKGLKKGKPKLNADGYVLDFYQKKSFMKDLEEYNRFIKGVETLVRASKEYKKFKAFVMEDKGMNYCQVFPHISKDLEEGKVPIDIDLHHGSILNLYDCCCIATDHMLNAGQKVTTFRVAKEIIKDHLEERIQVVVLCDLAHRLVHVNKIHLNPKMGIGDFGEFIKKYPLGIDEKRRRIINTNLEAAQNILSYDLDYVTEMKNIQRFDNK